MEKYRDFVIDVYRQLHKIPEVGGEEQETSQWLGEQLNQLGIPYKVVGKYGIVGVMDSGTAGKTLLLRADIDGLPMAEAEDNRLQKKKVISQHAGKAHMCGHDSHAAMLLTALKMLKEEKRQFKGKIVFCFEPGEENGYGFPFILEELKSYPIDNAWAIHVEPNIETGKLSVRGGEVMAAPISFDIRIQGKGAHASTPHLATDPITCMATMVMELSSVVQKEIDARYRAVLSIGKAVAGDAGNIIPETAQVVGTIRYFDKRIGSQLKSALERIVGGISHAHNCSASIRYQGEHIVPVINDQYCADIACQMVKDVFGENALIDYPAKMGSDGMGVFMEKYPGV